MQRVMVYVQHLLGGCKSVSLEVDAIEELLQGSIRVGRHGIHLEELELTVITVELDLESVGDAAVAPDVMAL